MQFDENDEAMRRLNQRYWEHYVQCASAHYVTKIAGIESFCGVLGAFHLDNTFHDHVAPNHIIYKLGEALMCADGSHGYEFVVEYDRYEPNVGIYFGVKGLIFDRANQHTVIEHINREWQQTREAVKLMLSNVYPQYNFDSDLRYKLTDNANNYTYWPFWITLQECEPVEVAAQAVTVIRKIYEQMMAGSLATCGVSTVRDAQPVVGAFTNKAYDRLVSSLAGKNAARVPLVSVAFSHFIEVMLREGIIERSSLLERGYVLKTIDMTEFAFLIVAFVERTRGEKLIRTPWQDVVNVFLNADMHRMDNLKRLYGAPDDIARRRAARRAAVLLNELLR